MHKTVFQSTCIAAVWILILFTGVPRADEKLDEESQGGFGFLAGIAQEIEDCSREFETLGLRNVTNKCSLRVDHSPVRRIVAAHHLNLDTLFTMLKGGFIVN